jgi:chemotaxis protein CheX
MKIEDDQIRRSVEDLWSSVLGLAIEPRPSPSFPDSSPGLLTGCVEISGAWEGVVTLDCGPTMARQAAGIMFGVEPGETSFDQIQDALGELTNILGGQFKALLPEPSRLSLPAVAEGADYAFRGLHDKVLARFAFACHDAPARVTIVESGR